MAEDKLAEIYNDFVAAREARDVAMESLGDAISALKAAKASIMLLCRPWLITLAT